MKTKRLALIPPEIIIAFCSLSVLAVDLRTLDGQTYYNITLTDKDAFGIKATWKGGAGRIEYKNMTDADKTQYGYNEEKALAEQEAKAIEGGVREVNGNLYDFGPLLRAKGTLFDNLKVIAKNVRLCSAGR